MVEKCPTACWTFSATGCCTKLLFEKKVEHRLFYTNIKWGDFLELTKGRFKQVEICIPQQPIVQEYSDVLKPIFNQIQCMLQRNENLKSTRDLLLPRLISGKLDVENLDIAFPQGMERGDGQ